MIPAFVILGASGFIGQHLTRIFVHHNIPVLCYSRKPILLKLPGVTYNTITCYANLELPTHATVYHLAETHHIREVEEKGKSYIKEVVQLTKSLLIKNVKRFIYASSTAVYDDSYSTLLPSDSEYLSRRTIYTQAKLAVEKLVLQYEGTVVRLTNTYGAGMSSLNIFADILRQLDHNKIILREATPIRDYIYIDDLVEGLFRLGIAELTGIYNLGSGVSYSCEQVCQAFLKITGKKDKKIEYLNPPRISSIYLDISKTVQALGWYPCHSLEDGIRKLLKSSYNG